MLDALGKPRDLQAHVPERLGQVDRHIGSTEKIGAADGLDGARTDFDDGLARTIRWYRENEAWWRPVAATPRSVSSS